MIALVLASYPQGAQRSINALQWLKDPNVYRRRTVDSRQGCRTPLASRSMPGNMEDDRKNLNYAQSSPMYSNQMRAEPLMLPAQGSGTKRMEENSSDRLRNQSSSPYRLSNIVVLYILNQLKSLNEMFDTIIIFENSLTEFCSYVRQL